jgi:hypothetical protein
MKKLYTLLLIAVSTTLSFGQTIYRENMGNTNVGGNTAIASHSGWLSENQTGLVYSGTASVRTSSQSSTYSGFSAGNNVFFSAAGGQTLIIDNLNTNAYPSTEILMTFGFVTTTSNAKIEIHTSTDNGATWSASPITYSTVAGTAWQLASVDLGQIPQSTDLALRFTGVVTTSGMRVDDIKIERFCPVQITFGTPTTTCDASTSNLDTYSLSIPYTGAGNAALVLTSSAGTISGDNPASVANGTILITGIAEGTNYLVTATQASCSKQVGGNSPECKVTNALPFNEPFNYSNGTALSTTQQWTNVSVASDEILSVSGNLSYTGITPTGNSVSFAGAGSDTKAPFTDTTSGELYASFLVSVTDLTGISTTGSTYFAVLSTAANSFTVARIHIKTDGTLYQFGISPTTVTTDIVWSANTYAVGSTQYLVLKYDFANNVLALIENPTIGGSGTAAVSVTPTAALTSLASFTLRQDSATSTPAMKIDELTIATTPNFTLSSSSFNAIEGLTMYPNPVSGGTLNFTSTANAAMSVQIFDLLGKEVLKSNVVNNTVNVAKLTAGVYVVKITEEGKTATRKLVIK